MTTPPNDESPLPSLVFGVLVGGVLGYLCLTDQGRSILRRMDGWLDGTVEQMQAIRQTTRKGRRVIEEIRETLVDLERALDDVAEPASESRRGDGIGSARATDAARH